MVYEREVRRLNAQQADIQARCGHTNTTFHRDPFGDSYYTCDVCGFRSRFEIEADPKRAKEVQVNQSRPTALRR
jgi:hypothetical protein